MPVLLAVSPHHRSRLAFLSSAGGCGSGSAGSGPGVPDPLGTSSQEERVTDYKGNVVPEHLSRGDGGLSVHSCSVRFCSRLFQSSPTARLSGALEMPEGKPFSDLVQRMIFFSTGHFLPQHQSGAVWSRQNFSYFCNHFTILYIIILPSGRRFWVVFERSLTASVLFQLGLTESFPPHILKSSSGLFHRSFFTSAPFTGPFRLITPPCYSGHLESESLLLSPSLPAPVVM